MQGVGFRVFVEAMARARGIHGRVWNEKDGSVGALFQDGESPVLDAAVDALYSGPGKVTSVVSQEWGGASYSDFQIVYRSPV